MEEAYSLSEKDGKVKKHRPSSVEGLFSRTRSVRSGTTAVRTAWTEPFPGRGVTESFAGTGEGR